MDDDVVKAIIAALRADSTINTAVAGRLFPAAQVPSDADWPRGYIGTMAPIRGDQWQEGRQFRMRFPRFKVEWAIRTIDSGTAQQDIEQLDARADAVLKDLVIANVEWLYRSSDIPVTPQDNDEVQYLTVGGIWTALREYEYYP